MELHSSLAGVGVTLFGGSYAGRRVLLTGHTGFKGSWLALWLQELGAEVIGVSLPPATTPSHWRLLGLDMAEHLVDIRDGEALSSVVSAARPDIVFHLAAQALVRRSYRSPVETWSTNVLGTANLLEACRPTGGPRAIVVVTTDKCYENKEWVWGYRENDRLGGHDPYSASKAATELVVSSYRSALLGPQDALVATARAGNVIGGGDWSEDRLVPDLVRAVLDAGPLEVRSPGATRPWQHVLESLSGYLVLGQRLLAGDRQVADAWNFGPDPDGNRSVETVIRGLADHWPDLRWRVTSAPQPHEAQWLYLDSSKAKARLGWLPIWGLDDTLAATALWYRQHASEGVAHSREQLIAYVDAARRRGVAWAGLP